MVTTTFIFATIANSQEPRPMTIHEKHKEWLEGRKIDATLAEKFGLETVHRDGKNWLAIPYSEGGDVVNHKYRLTSAKDHRMDAGAPLLLWNADTLKNEELRNGQKPLVITEGEWDALAALQSGVEHVVSVPNGAPGKPTEDIDTAKRYEWVDRHASDLAGIRSFILALDNDDAGHNLRADLVALLGADRCNFVEYPESCKDLNEVLVTYGQEMVSRCLLNAKPFPVQGLYRVTDFPERGEVRFVECGIDPISDFIKIVPGTLTVLTGFANMGKSTLMNAIIGTQIKHHFPVCIASFETDVNPILVDGLRMAILGCSKGAVKGHSDRPRADQCIMDRLSIISQTVDEDMEMDLDKFLDLCRVAVMRHKVKMIVLDPWNELEHKRRRDETETDYIGRAIRAIKRFAKQHDVAFWVVAHPTKPDQGGNKRPPGLYDISGSANWANKADYGLTYHRPNFDQNYAEIVISKVRMGLPGMKGKVDVSYDFDRSEFVTFAG